MIILGIDPGTATTGWGVIQKDRLKNLFIDCGIVKTEPSQAPSKRLLTIFNDITQLLQKYKPDIVCVEQLFFNTNTTTAMAVGQARGVILLAIEQHGIEVVSYTPLQVKMAMTGYGRADKTQIQRMVKETLKLKAIPKPDDAADALAIGLTYSSSIQSNH